MEKLLQEYRENFDKFKVHNYDLIFDKNWEKIEIDKIEWVVVGDNPGVNEKANCEYFSSHGHTGNRVRLYFRDQLKVKTENILFLNKVPIHTSKTAELKDVENLIGLVEPIYQLLNSLIKLKPELDFLIMGKGKNHLNKIFYKGLNQVFFKNNHFHFTPHFSNSAFQKVRNKYTKKVNNESEILKEISKETRHDLVTKFKIKSNYTF